MNASKLLIVDDDEEMCEEMGGVLRDEGYQVVALYNGLEGLAYLETQPCDILLLDLKTPGLTGFQVLQAVKERLQLSSKVIVLTGRPLVKPDPDLQPEVDKAEEERLLKLADAVINKPFDVETVLSVIQRLTCLP